MTTKSDIITGNQALAYGALEAGVQFVSGYPGSPSTATVDALLDLAGDSLEIEWAINEKSAFDAAFGASLAGLPALVCLKSVGLNVALDSLMVANLAPGDGPFVVLAGDDPGGWGSQNEQDSRLLAAAAEVPLLEPTTTAGARDVMRRAFGLSARHRLPVVVRFTRALATAPAGPRPASVERPAPRPAAFRRQPERLNVLPIHVVEFHQRLQAALAGVRAEFEDSDLNQQGGSGRWGIIAAGQAYEKLTAVLDRVDGTALPVLALGSLHPLPQERIAGFLQGLEAVLVVEETAPYVEVEIQALAQRAGLSLPIYGRLSGHLPGSGEIFAGEITGALASLWPNAGWPSPQPGGRPMPSRRPLCDDCPYVPTLETLLAVMERHGGREAFVVTGETGCMVRAQLPPWQIMDLKYGMGSSIGLAAGLARAGIPQKVVALSGDSAFLHSGLGELIDAVQAGANLLVVLLANEITALSGGQPHPATDHDSRGQARVPVDLAALIRAAGVPGVQVVDPEEGMVLEDAFEAGLNADGPAVVIVQQPCPRWVHKKTDS